MEELTKGGAFLLANARPADVFTPEDLDDELKLIAATTRQFVQNELLPVTARLEKLEPGLSEELMRKVGELGLLAIEVPEEYGGSDLSKAAVVVAVENLVGNGFSTTFAAHQSIGTLPLVYFGNHEQKSRYLPKLITAEIIGAYALTEPQAGSDALGGSMKAELSPDGRHYVLDGTKMWISNAGFADLFTVFAKVDGDKKKFSAFLVERDWPGVSTGAEEKKMGIKSSSTRQVMFENVEVPAANLLGEIGHGAKIAFNILNIGRFKLGAACVGGAKQVLEIAARYAKERVQFNVPIASFGMIQEKLAETATQIYVAESAVYRTAGLIDQAIGADKDPAFGLKCIEEYAVECSIIKILGSELLDYAVDEGVQIHGGYGFSQDYEIERQYRDSRINRIYEGTNEINRLIIPTMLMKRAAKGELPITGPTQNEGSPPPDAGAPEDHALTQARLTIERMKQATLQALGLVMKAFGQAAGQQQEVLARLADMVIAVYACESALLRAHKSHRGSQYEREVEAMVMLSVHAALQRVAGWHREIVCAASEDRSEREQSLALSQQLLAPAAVDAIALRRLIAKPVLERDGYFVT